MTRKVTNANVADTRTKEDGRKKRLAKHASAKVVQGGSERVRKARATVKPKSKPTSSAGITVNAPKRRGRPPKSEAQRVVAEATAAVEKQQVQLVAHNDFQKGFNLFESDEKFDKWDVAALVSLAVIFFAGVFVGSFL